MKTITKTITTVTTVTLEVTPEEIEECVRQYAYNKLGLKPTDKVEVSFDVGQVLRGATVQYTHTSRKEG